MSCSQVRDPMAQGNRCGMNVVLQHRNHLTESARVAEYVLKHQALQSESCQLSAHMPLLQSGIPDSIRLESQTMNLQQRPCLLSFKHFLHFLRLFLRPSQDPDTSVPGKPSGGYCISGNRGDARKKHTYLINEHIIKDSGFPFYLFTHLLPCLPIHFPPGFDDLRDVFPHHVLMNIT